MTRVLLSGVLGGIAMWFIGFIFWGTPLSAIALKSTDDATGAAVQAALAQHLGPGGTGVYAIPWPGTAAGNILYSQGPTATVFFNSSGFPAMDSGALIGGLVLGTVCALIVALAIHLFARPLAFADRLKLAAFFALAIPAYIDLGQPIFNHAPWGYFVYLFVSDALSFLAAGAIAAWMVGRPAAPLGAR